VTSGRSFQAIGPALVAWTARLYNMTDDLGVKTMLKGRPARNLVPGQAGRLRTAELRTSDQAARVASAHRERPLLAAGDRGDGAGIIGAVVNSPIYLLIIRIAAFVGARTPAALRRRRRPGKNTAR
jgi:hypothetical protein